MLLVAGMAACGGGGGGGAGEGEWQVERRSEGDVTTVRTVAGSMWGGAASLVEELSIGVEGGEEAYMFGRIGGIAPGEGRVYVLDSGVPVVRVFDLEGNYLFDVGKSGQGPGEYGRPFGMVLDRQGRLVVRDPENGRFVLFDADGRFIETWPLDRGFFTSQALVVSYDGTLYNPGFVGEAERPSGGGGVRVFSARQMGMVPWGPEGAAGEPLMPPAFEHETPRLEQITRSGQAVMARVYSVPFWPSSVWTLAPSGAIVAGVATDYRFEIQTPDGAVTAVEKAWEPIAVQAEEAAWHKEHILEQMHQGNPEATWNAPEIPSTKPAYASLYADDSNRIWVRREGEGIYDPACEGAADDRRAAPPADARVAIAESGDVPCWTSEEIVEVFDLEGAFLGAVELPDGASFMPGREKFIRGGDVWLAVEDELGTITVKRYRLVTPSGTSVAGG